MASEIASADLRSVVNAVGREIEITYRLIREPDGYGLSACITGDPGGAVRIERLTADPAAAKQILALLAENQVFPYNICEVLDDLLAVDPMI